MPSIALVDGNERRRRDRGVFAVLSLIVCLYCLTPQARAQDQSVNTAWPQEPRSQQAPEAKTFASVAGVVTDTDGDVVPGAKIVLTTGISASPQQTVSDEQGRFTFAAVSMGNYKIIVMANGLATRAVTGALLQGEERELAPIALQAAASVGVDVVVSQHDLAEEELKVEEKQRVGGFIPNFYVTYDWKAAPLTRGQKFELAWRTSVDPASFLLNGAFAGVQQANNSFAGYGQGAAGYGKRFGAATADYTVGTMMGGYVLPVLFRQDPRYFYMGTGTIRHRALYALAAAFICRGDNGKWQPNYSSVLGNLAAGAISNIYYPASDRDGATLTIENGLLSSGADALGNVVQEFLIRHITPGTHKQQP